MLSSEITLPEASPDKEEALVSTRKDYPGLPQTITADELTLHFSPTEEEIEFTTKGARSSGSRLSWLVLLKLFQRLPRFPSPDEISPAVINPLRIHLRLGAAVEFEHDARKTPKGVNAPNVESITCEANKHTLVLTSC